MELNFDAQVRLTEALLALLRRSAPSAIVNVASTAGRVSRASSGAYSASKFALAGWSDALHLEEAPHGVHVGFVLPGYVATEGFPQAESSPTRSTRRLVSTPERVADVIVDAGPGGRAERYVPRPNRLAAAARAPGARARAPRDGGRGAGLAPGTRPDQLRLSAQSVHQPRWMSESFSAWPPKTSNSMPSGPASHSRIAPGWR